MALTEKFIRELTEPGIYWDGEIPGFAIRVYPNGKKSFFLDYRYHGRKTRKVLGKWPATPLKIVREIARQKYTVAKAGIQPFKKKEENLSPLFSIFATEFLSRWVERRNKAVHANNTRLRLQNKLVPVFGLMPIHQIGKAEVVSFFEECTRKRGAYEANRCLALLHKMFECALGWGYLPEGADNPAQRIEKNKEKSRDVFLDPDGFRRLVAALEEEDLFVRNGIWLFLLTGLRKMELLCRKWEDLDVERRLLRLPDTKAGRPFYLPLSEAAMERFLALPRQAGNPYIFYGKNPGTHLHDFPRFAWKRIRERAGLQDMTIHALRHTVASWLAQDGKSLKQIGAMLNQSSQSVTDRYAHLQAEALRGLVDEHSDRIHDIVNK